MKFYSSSNHLMLLCSSTPTLLSNWKKSKSPSPFTQLKLQLNEKSRNYRPSNLQPLPPVMAIHFRVYQEPVINVFHHYSQYKYNTTIPKQPAHLLPKSGHDSAIIFLPNPYQNVLLLMWI